MDITTHRACQYRVVGGDDFELEGANASAEEEVDNGEAEKETVIDKVYDFKLQPMGEPYDNP